MVNYKVQMPTKSIKNKKKRIPVTRKDQKSRNLMELVKGNRYIVDSNEIYQKIKPYLLLGVSLKRACNQALIPYSTATKRYNSDIFFADLVDNAQDNVSNIARSKLALKVKDQEHFNKDSVKYWLDNIDSGIKRSSVKGTKVQAGDVTISIVSYD